MKNIAVITTGGTIGSILSTDSVAVELTGKRILDEIELVKNKLGCSVSISSPINKNSENVLPIDWVKILHAIKQANDDKESIGIVVTHGTDTLAYSVAAALAFRNLWNKKVCFTGSYYAPNHPASDTSISLLSSLEFASSPQPASGVFVACRSNESNSEAKIIQGANLKPMAFDDLFFESVYSDNVLTFSPKDGIPQDISLTTVNSPYLSAERLPEIKDVEMAGPKVGLITLYPGIDRAMLDAAVKGRDILILQAYHCGTGPSSIDNDLLDFIKETRLDTKILIGTFPKKYIDVPYESSLKLKEAGAHLYADLQVHFLYVFSILGLSLSMPSLEIVKKLKEYEI